MQSKIRLLGALVYIIFMYAGETWTLTNVHRHSKGDAIAPSWSSHALTRSPTTRYAVISSSRLHPPHPRRLSHFSEEKEAGTLWPHNMIGWPCKASSSMNRGGTEEEGKTKEWQYRGMNGETIRGDPGFATQPRQKEETGEQLRTSAP